MGINVVEPEEASDNEERDEEPEEETESESAELLEVRRKVPTKSDVKEPIERTDSPTSSSSSRLAGKGVALKEAAPVGAAGGTRLCRDGCPRRQRRCWNQLAVRPALRVKAHLTTIWKTRSRSQSSRPRAPI
jgi:hypothetical protein